MTPELQVLHDELTLLHGQIDGALGTLKLGLGLVGILLSALVGVCVYVFLSLNKAHIDTERKVSKHETRITRVEERVRLEAR